MALKADGNLFALGRRYRELAVVRAILAQQRGTGSRWEVAAAERELMRHSQRQRRGRDQTG